MFFKYCAWTVCLRDVNAVERWCWEQYCGGIRLVSSALYPWWQDHCRWSDRYFAVLCFFCLLLLWSRICVSYGWNILSIKVRSSNALQYQYRFFLHFAVNTVEIILQTTVLHGTSFPVPLPPVPASSCPAPIPVPRSSIPILSHSREHRSRSRPDPAISRWAYTCVFPDEVPLL